MVEASGVEPPANIGLGCAGRRGAGRGEGQGREQGENKGKGSGSRSKERQAGAHGGLLC
jgi:hypothetical protein